MAKERDAARQKLADHDAQANDLNLKHVAWVDNLARQFAQMQADKESYRMRCVDATDSQMVLVNPTALAEVTAELAQGLQEAWDAYLQELSIFLNVPRTCRDAVLKDVHEDEDPEGDAAEGALQQKAILPFPGVQAQHTLATETPPAPPAPAGSSTEKGNSLHELRSSKAEIDMQIENLRQVFEQLHTEGSSVSRCANRACVPRGLLELSIEQSRGL